MNDGLPLEIAVTQPPPGCTLRVERTADGLTLTLPSTLGFGGAVLSVVGDQLRVERRGYSGDEAHHWTVRQLADVRVGRIVDNEGPDTFELHIQPHPGEGKRFRLPLKDEAEARWAAETLRHALHLPDTVPFLEREEQPAGSKILLARSPAGVALEVPATGPGHPMAASRIIGGLVASLIAVILVIVVVEFPDPEPLQGFPPVTRTLLICGASILGIGFLADGINRSVRRALLGISGDTLIVRQTSLWGTNQNKWLRSRVADVRVGSTAEGAFTNAGLRQRAIDNQDPTWELQIHLRTGEIIRMLDGYGDADLQWAATVLRRALRVPEAPSPSTDAGPLGNGGKRSPDGRPG